MAKTIILFLKGRNLRTIKMSLYNKDCLVLLILEHSNMVKGESPKHSLT